MLIVISGIDGYHVTDLITDRHNHNARYFIGNAIEPVLRAIFPDGWKAHSRRLNVDLDKCRVHGSKTSDAFFTENDIVRVLHSASRHDVAPSGFWLFGHTKGALTEQQFTGPSDLLDGTQLFLYEIQRLNCNLASITGSGESDRRWTMTETTSMNETNVITITITITIVPSSAPTRLSTLLIGPYLRLITITSTIDPINGHLPAMSSVESRICRSLQGSRKRIHRSAKVHR
jgi:hypothetical protein